MSVLPSGAWVKITDMLAVGVTSDKVTKIRAVATIEPPPKIARTDSSHIIFNGKTSGKEPE